MALVRVTPPAAPVLTLEQARAQVKVDVWGSPPVHRDDQLLQDLVQAATDELDGADGWLGRALVTQTWKLLLDGFPYRGFCDRGTIPLPLSPVQSVESVSYTDPDGVERTLDVSGYRQVLDADPAYLEPAFGTSWPRTRDILASVAITYVAGYGDPDDVPAIIKNYIRARVGQFYAHRELAVVGTIVTPMPFMRDNLESIRLRGVNR